MKIYILKKLKNRKYDSEDLLCKVLFEEGLTNFEVKRKENGQLYLLSSCDAIQWNVSVSHTKNYWACALCEKTIVGIDIEESNREISKGMARMFHPLEQEYLNAFAVDSREWKDEFLRIWTRKESFIKCLGTGLSEGLSTFSAVNESGEPADVLVSKNGRRLYGKNIYIAAGLCAGVCTERIEDRFDVMPFRYSGTPVKSAFEQAADILAVRDYSSAGLIRKLTEKGHSREEAGNAAAEMMERGYIDDPRYARHLAEQAVEKGKGKYRIKKELSEKGVQESLIQEVLCDVCADETHSERERALQQAKRMLGYTQEEEGDQDLPALTEKDWNKVGRKLSALGYEPSVIYETLDRLGR